jgi:hypothetical protein
MAENEAVMDAVLLKACLVANQHLDYFRENKGNFAKVNKLAEKLSETIEKEKVTQHEAVMALTATLVAATIDQEELVAISMAGKNAFEACMPKRRRSGLIAEPKPRAARAGK